MSSELTWFTSSHSNSEGGVCAEVDARAGAVPLRDSKDRSGPRLTFTPDAWSAFLEFTRRAAGRTDVDRR